MGSARDNIEEHPMYKLTPTYGKKAADVLACFHDKDRCPFSAHDLIGIVHDLTEAVANMEKKLECKGVL